MPLVSKDWKPGLPAAAFLKIGCSADELAESGVYKGIVPYSGMPGHVRAAFERSKIRPRSGFLVVEWDQGPEAVRVDSMFLFGTAIVTMVLVILLLVQDHRRETAQAAAAVDERTAQRTRMLESLRGGGGAAVTGRPIEPK